MMRRPRSAISPESALQVPSQGAAKTPLGIWYVAVFTFLLLIAAGIYIVYLYQKQLEWQDAARQLTIGQELLQTDRDDILRSARDREFELQALERELSERDERLASLQAQRTELSTDVARLAQDLAQAERQLQQRSVTGDPGAHALSTAPSNGAGDVQAPKTDHLRKSLADARKRLEESEDAIDHQALLALEARQAMNRFQDEAARAQDQLTEAQQAFKTSQILHGHYAGFGMNGPFEASLGPEHWQDIEGWLSLHLEQKMTIPDLSAIGWSYEGGRLLRTLSGPPMVMLLYADPKGEPATLTIARDGTGDLPARSQQQAGVQLIQWRDQEEAFFLAGTTDEVTLQVVASALRGKKRSLSENRTVPASRFFRPVFRPSRF